MISIKEFEQLDLRVAEIVSARPHPNADRLMVLDIQVGAQPKRVVAGIRTTYSAEELVGKKVVVVNNLEPATIRGIQSEGMLLAASEGDSVILVTPDRDISSGTAVR